MPAFVWSPFMKNVSSDFSHLFHLTDWLPTIMAAASDHYQVQKEEVEEGEIERKEVERKELEKKKEVEEREEREETEENAVDGVAGKSALRSLIKEEEEEGDGFSHWQDLNQLDTNAEGEASVTQ